MSNGMFEFLVGMYIIMLFGLIYTVWDIEHKGDKDGREKRTT